jgi:hypothetical protein
MFRPRLDTGESVYQVPIPAEHPRLVGEQVLAKTVRPLLRYTVSRRTADGPGFRLALRGGMDFDATTIGAVNARMWPETFAAFIRREKARYIARQSS